MTASAVVTVPSQVTGTTTVTNATCTGNSGAITLNPNGGTPGYTYLWSPGAATTQSISSLSVGTYSVTFKDTKNCVASTSATIIIEGSAPLTPGEITGPAYVCKSQTNVVFNIVAVSGATSYTWTKPTGATGTSTSNSITLSFSSTFAGGVLKVKANNLCGSSPDAILTLIVPSAPPPTPGTISGANNICSVGNSIYSIAPVSNATGYNWTITGTGLSIVSGQNTTSIVVAAAAGFTSGIISVKAVNCKGSSANKTKNVYGPSLSTPAFCNGGNDNLTVGVCAGSNHDYEVCAIVGATSYTWSAPAGAIINDGLGNSGNPLTQTQMNPSVNEWEVSITFPNNFVSGNVTVFASNDCGSTVAVSLPVQSKPNTPGAITGPVTNVCKKSGQVYSVAAITGATSYTWTVPSGVTITNGATTRTITVTYGNSFTGSGNITVKANNSCGSSAISSITVNAATLAPGTIAGPSPVCKSQTKSYSVATVTGATSYTWTASNGATFVGSATGATVNVKFTGVSGSSVNLTVKANNACASSAISSKLISVTSGCKEDEYGNIVYTDFFVYPNPTSGDVNIEFNAQFNVKYLFDVTDVLGRTILKSTESFAQGQNIKHIDMSKTAAGVYFIRIEEEGVEVKTLKIIVE